MIWYTSDLHIGHRKVAELRGFGDDTDAHDATIVKNWRSVVNPDDIVFVLGDITLSNTENALEVLSGLPGRKQLIAGNHDACHPLHKNAFKEQKKYLTVFESVQAFARRKASGIEFLMSHFPYEGDSKKYEERYREFRLRNMGKNLIHGHTHSAVRITSDTELHVGLDAWDMKLVPETHVINYFTVMKGLQVT